MNNSNSTNSSEAPAARPPPPDMKKKAVPFVLLTQSLSISARANPKNPKVVRKTTAIFGRLDSIGV
jgi:hypothetical protein